MRRTKATVLKDLYKGQTREFADFAPESFSWKFIEKPSFDKHLKPLLKRTLKVLDIGCGDGRIIEYLIAHGVEETNIVGVDINKELLSRAERKLTQVKFICSDITSPKLSFKGLDLIVSSMVFFYLDQKQLEKVLISFYKWSGKGGVLFYITGHPIRFVHRSLGEYFDRRWADQETPWGTNMPHFRRTVGDYVNATIKAGFTVEVVDEPEVLKKGKIYSKEYKKYTSFPSRLMVKAIKL